MSYYWPRGAGRSERGSRWATRSRGGRSERSRGRVRRVERFANQVLDNRPPLTDTYRSGRRYQSVFDQRRDGQWPSSDERERYSSREDSRSRGSSRQPSRLTSREPSREPSRIGRPPLLSHRNGNDSSSKYDHEKYSNQKDDHSQDPSKQSSTEPSSQSKAGIAVPQEAASSDNRHKLQSKTQPAQTNSVNRGDVNQRIKERDERVQVALRVAINAYLEETPGLFPGARRELPKGVIKSLDISLGSGSVDNDIQRGLRHAFDKIQWADLTGVIKIHSISLQPGN